jgi:hypothetical protein
MMRMTAILLLMFNLSGCSSSDPAFEDQVNQSWEEAFRKAQLDPCSFEGSSIRNATDRDPRFAAWAASHPLSACPPRTNLGGSDECGGYDDFGNYIKFSCDEALGQSLNGGQ